MSTQNVNEKPSTKESTTLRTDGFVRNIHPKTGDKSADERLNPSKAGRSALSITDQAKKQEEEREANRRLKKAG
ncbi:hypothetical protein XC68_15585 [Klebsiella pneumoniae]|nr:hypothetical protein [Klebsiella pneumoniae]